MLAYKVNLINYMYQEVYLAYYTDKALTGILLIGYGLFVIFLVSLIIILSFFLSPQFRFSSEKQTSYECGFEPFGDARLSFDIHFYIIGLLFLIFDLELIFLFPWLFSFSEQTFLFSMNFFSMMLFLFLLGFGFVYEWYNSALVWVPVQTVKR